MSAGARVLERLELTFEVAIRRCEERDLSLLEWLGSLSAHREFMRAQFVRHLRGDNVMLVADLAGYPVGQTWIDLERRAADGGAFVWALRVIQPMQRMGIAKALLAAAERIACDAGRAFVELGVERVNGIACDFYVRRGYAFVGDDVCEEHYVAPDGRAWSHVYDQAILRKSLGGASPTRAYSSAR